MCIHGSYSGGVVGIVEDKVIGHYGVVDLQWGAGVVEVVDE